MILHEQTFIIGLQNLGQVAEVEVFRLHTPAEVEVELVRQSQCQAVLQRSNYELVEHPHIATVIATKLPWDKL